jgi:hypothetical protein
MDAQSVKCRETIKLGADIGHTARDHHPSYIGRGLADFHDAHNPQRSVS